MKDQTYFCKDWLEDSDFNGWIKETKDITQARCTVCHKSFKLWNMGRHTLTSKTGRGKHEEHVFKNVF